jgi:hypothetical protein
MRTPADQGRLLFPALLPVALTLAYGLSQWSRRWSFPIVTILALATSVYCAGVLVPNAFARPIVLEAENLPPQTARLNHDLGLGLELVAVNVETSDTKPGDVVGISLYWRRRDAPADTAGLVLKILGRAYAQIGGLPAIYHVGGMYPPVLWQEGQIVQERLTLRLNDELDAPTIGRLFVQLEGQEEAHEVGAVKVVPHKWLPSGKLPVAHLGEGIALAFAVLEAETAARGESLAVDLRWQVSQAPDRDLITFVHLGDPTQPPLAQADGPALGGDYPTGLWAAGEVFDDQYVLSLPTDIPPGRYPVHLGLYDPDSGARLALSVGGERQPNDALLVGWVTVD